MSSNITNKELPKVKPVNAVSYSVASSAAEDSAITVSDSDTAVEEDEMEDEEIGFFRGVPYQYPSAMKRKLRSYKPMVTKKYTLQHDSGVEHDVVIELTGHNEHERSWPRGVWTGERRLPWGGTAHYSFYFDQHWAKMVCTKSGSEFRSDFNVKEDKICFCGTLTLLDRKSFTPLLEFNVDDGYQVFSAVTQLNAAAKADLIEAALLKEEES